MVDSNGVFYVPVSINGHVVIDFVLDSGASDVSLPREIAQELIRQGTLTEKDFLGGQTYTLADGSRVNNPKFKLRTMKLGTLTLTNVQASISARGSQALLGQSFLKRLGKWSLDSDRKVLTFSTPPKYRFASIYVSPDRDFKIAFPSKPSAVDMVSLPEKGNVLQRWVDWQVEHSDPHIDFSVMIEAYRDHESLLKAKANGMQWDKDQGNGPYFVKWRGLEVIRLKGIPLHLSIFTHTRSYHISCGSGVSQQDFWKFAESFEFLDSGR